MPQYDENLNVVTNDRDHPHRHWLEAAHRQGDEESRPPGEAAKQLLYDGNQDNLNGDGSAGLADETYCGLRLAALVNRELHTQKVNVPDNQARLTRVLL
ncbi:uncharacterized protein JN550_002270 [Neoarthrinium moseri]|uniref:uncharacterized protein n=1 Tax=Neoarthrinium moseri TaxID=1658444 RepID=UPI001FDE502D|nr:uncharacterized protein JN550_002270 [Neoarthrinium moseri]KAI1874841.1 hypothetical protein JN550_002270 [Neoarthrinium moseri]